MRSEHSGTQGRPSLLALPEGACSWGGGVAGGKQSLPRKQGEYDRGLGDVKECGIKAIRSPW